MENKMPWLVPSKSCRHKQAQWKQGAWPVSKSPGEGQTADSQAQRLNATEIRSEHKKHQQMCSAKVHITGDNGLTCLAAGSHLAQDLVWELSSSRERRRRSQNVCSHPPISRLLQTAVGAVTSFLSREQDRLLSTFRRAWPVAVQKQKQRLRLLGNN